MNNYTEKDIHNFKSATSTYIDRSSASQMSQSKEILNSREMILKVFSNIDRKRFEEKDSIDNAWKKIITSIKSTTSKEDVGSKLFYHSSIIDLKNEILLIETDHPGFIQMFRIYEKYILNGLKKFVPSLSIKSLSFRLKGSDAVLADKIVEQHKKIEIEEQDKLRKTDEEIENFYKKSDKAKKINQQKNMSEKNNETISQTPAKLAEAFERMKKSMQNK